MSHNSRFNLDLDPTSLEEEEDQSSEIRRFFRRLPFLIMPELDNAGAAADNANAGAGAAAVVAADNANAGVGAAAVVAADNVNTGAGAAVANANTGAGAAAVVPAANENADAGFPTGFGSRNRNRTGGRFGPRNRPHPADPGLNPNPNPNPNLLVQPDPFLNPNPPDPDLNPNPNTNPNPLVQPDPFLNPNPPDPDLNPNPNPLNQPQPDLNPNPNRLSDPNPNPPNPDLNPYGAWNPVLLYVPPGYRVGCTLRGGEDNRWHFPGEENHDALRSNDLTRLGIAAARANHYARGYKCRGESEDRKRAIREGRVPLEPSDYVGGRQLWGDIEDIELVVERLSKSSRLAVRTGFDLDAVLYLWEKGHGSLDTTVEVADQEMQLFLNDRMRRKLKPMFTFAFRDMAGSSSSSTGTGAGVEGTTVEETEEEKEGDENVGAGVEILEEGGTVEGKEEEKEGDETAKGGEVGEGEQEQQEEAEDWRVQGEDDE